MNHYKYPRTMHIPASTGCSSDDKILTSTAHLHGQDVVISMKMDGECSSLYRDRFHAKSLDGPHHPSRDWLAAFHARIAYEIPKDWRICGENLYAKHSLWYDNLPSYFMGFSVWDETNTALPWMDTLEVFDVLGIEPVPVLARGPFSEAMVKQLIKTWDPEKDEGFVIRLAGAIAYKDFGQSVAKWVRDGHVQTDEHWMHQAVVPNKLALEVLKASKKCTP